MDQLCCTIFKNVPIPFWWTSIIVIRVGFLQTLFVMFVWHKSHGWRSRGRSWRASRVVACSVLSQGSLALYSLPVESTLALNTATMLSSWKSLLCAVLELTTSFPLLCFLPRLWEKTSRKWSSSKNSWQYNNLWSHKNVRNFQVNIVRLRGVKKFVTPFELICWIVLTIYWDLYTLVQCFSPYFGVNGTFFQHGGQPYRFISEA